MAARFSIGARRAGTAAAWPPIRATPEPVVQVYAARAWGWKGVFAVHSWIVTKRANAPAFERYEVVGWACAAGPGGAPQHARDRRPLGRQ